MKTMGEVRITAFSPVLYIRLTIDAGAEFLIMRPLKVKKIADLP